MRVLQKCRQCAVCHASAERTVQTCGAQVPDSGRCAFSSVMQDNAGRAWLLEQSVGLCINVFRPVFLGSDRRVPHGLTLQLEMRGQHLSLFKTTFPLRNRAECRGFLLQGVWGRGGKKHCTKQFLPYCDAATAVTQTVHIPGASEKVPCTGQPKGAKVCVKKFWQSFYPVLHFWH